MNRRLFLFGTTALGISACTTIDTAIADAADKVSTITTSLQQMLSNPLVVSLIPAGTLGQINVWLVELQSAAAALRSALTSGGAQSAGKQALTLIEAILGVLSKLPLPQPFPMIVLSVSVLLPIIANAFGFAAKPMGNPSGMTPDQAMITLKAYNTKK